MGKDELMLEGVRVGCFAGTGRGFVDGEGLEEAAVVEDKVFDALLCFLCGVEVVDECGEVRLGFNEKVVEELDRGVVE